MGDLQPVDRHLVLSAIEVDDVVFIMGFDDAVRAGIRLGEWLAVAILANEDVSGAGQVCGNLGGSAAVVGWRWGKS